MAKPGYAPIEFVQGDAWAGTVTIQGVGAALPPDITTWATLAQIRPVSADHDAGPASAVITSTVTGPQAISLSLTPAATVKLSGRYQWDLQVSNGGTPTTILAGPVKSRPEVSR